MIDISVVIPVKDEALILNELVKRLCETLNQSHKTYEILFVTDKNKDNTYEVLYKLHLKDSRIKIIKLSGYSNQHIAIFAGLKHASGEAVVTMDGDLQDYPEDIPKLYDKLREGFDVVYSIKKNKDNSIIRNIFSKMFVKLLNIFSDEIFSFNTNMFRIISRRTVNELVKFNEKEPALTGLIALIDYPTAGIEVTSGKRLKGSTKYSYIRQINLAISFLLSFSTKPLRIISIIGLFFAVLSFTYLIVVVYQKLAHDIAVLGWSTLIILITFFGGAQLFALGVIGEYIGRIFIETKNRPLYFIEKKIGDLK